MMKLIVEEYNKDRQQKEMSIQSLQGEMSMLQSLNEEIKDRNDELFKEVVDLQNTNNEKTKTIEELDVSLEQVTSRCEEMKVRMIELDEVHVCSYFHINNHIIIIYP